MFPIKKEVRTMNKFDHRAQPPPKRRVPGVSYVHLPRVQAIRRSLRNLQFRLGSAALAANTGTLRYSQ